MVRKYLIRVFFWLLYSKGDRIFLRAACHSITGQDGIPNYGRPSGQDARRDVACEYVKLMRPDMKDREINLGVELAYWTLRCR